VSAPFIVEVPLIALLLAVGFAAVEVVPAALLAVGFLWAEVAVVEVVPAVLSAVGFPLAEVVGSGMSTVECKARWWAAERIS
jgi:hypothetical protein